MFPTSFSEEDRVNARAARLIIEDRIVASPQARSFRCQLSGDADTSDEVLRHTLQDEVYIRWPAESYPFTIGHRDFDLGLVWILHPRAHAVNGAAAVAAIEASCADGFEVQFTPGDDPFFYVASLDPDAATRAADNRTFTAWGLPGIDEPWLDRPWFNGGQAV